MNIISKIIKSITENRDVLETRKRRLEVSLDYDRSKITEMEIRLTNNDNSTPKNKLELEIKEISHRRISTEISQLKNKITNMEHDLEQINWKLRK